MIIGKYWVAEYSESQNAFHCDTLEGSLGSNIKRVAGKKANDYIVFFIGDSMEECWNTIDEMKLIQEKRKEPDFSNFYNSFIRKYIK